MDERSTKWTRAGNLVSNGPFTLTEWTPNSRIVVTKNPLYWDAARSRLNRIIFFPSRAPDVEERNFRSGQLHLTYDLPVSKIATYRAQTPSPFRNDQLLDILYLNFNVKKPPLDNLAGTPRASRLASIAGPFPALSLKASWPATYSHRSRLIAAWLHLTPTVDRTTLQKPAAYSPKPVTPTAKVFPLCPFRYSMTFANPKWPRHFKPCGNANWGYA